MRKKKYMVLGRHTPIERREFHFEKIEQFKYLGMVFTDSKKIRIELKYLNKK